MSKLGKRDWLTILIVIGIGTLVLAGLIYLVIEALN